MQTLEDIAKFIDNFAYCNEGGGVFLSTNHTEASIIPKTALSFGVLGADNGFEKCRFELSRIKTDGVMKSIGIHVIVNQEGKGEKMVKTCLLSSLNVDTPQAQEEAKDRAVLRDIICKHLAPALGIFPILSSLTTRNQLEAVCTPSNLSASRWEEMPRRCMKLRGINTKIIFISLNAEDELITWENNEDQSETTIKTWKWGEGGEHNHDVLDGSTVMLLTYILGTAMIEIQ